MHTWQRQLFQNHIQTTKLEVASSLGYTKSQLLSDPLLSACCSPLQAESASEGWIEGKKRDTKYMINCFENIIHRIEWCTEYIFTLHKIFETIALKQYQQNLLLVNKRKVLITWCNLLYV